MILLTADGEPVINLPEDFNDLDSDEKIEKLTEQYILACVAIEQNVSGEYVLSLSEKAFEEMKVLRSEIIDFTSNALTDSFRYIKNEDSDRGTSHTIIKHDEVKEN
jgi:hypothetical protein